MSFGRSLINCAETSRSRSLFKTSKPFLCNCSTDDMILPILQIPNPLLKARAHFVKADTAGLQIFIDNMVETMYRHPRCVGLAATQVGKPWRIIVVDASRIDKPGSQHG